MITIVAVKGEGKSKRVFRTSDGQVRVLDFLLRPYRAPFVKEGWNKRREAYAKDPNKWVVDGSLVKLLK